MDIWNIIINGYKGYANYLWYEITHPGLHNYFYWLIFISAFFFILELSTPWRAKQPKFRKDFWLDFFYMFFNFFLFSLIIYNAASDVIVNLINNGIKSIFSFDLQAINPLRNLPLWSILIIGFIVRDFVQWWTHRLLHRVPRLWKFHQVHHSVEQMGFAAHLRYHWMETLVYRSLEYFPLALLGIGLYDFFIIHIFTLAIGHFNHSNISIEGKYTGAILGAFIGALIAFSAFDIQIAYGASQWERRAIIFAGMLVGYFIFGPWMRKIFNSPEMHIWHHAYTLPESNKYGVNFGISLAIWDYLFGTAYVPSDGRDIKLGFPGVEEFPDNFGQQFTHGFGTEED